MKYCILLEDAWQCVEYSLWMKKKKYGKKEKKMYYCLFDKVNKMKSV